MLSSSRFACPVALIWRNFRRATGFSDRSPSSIVEVRVADRGLGIDAEDLPHIFEPFYRGRRAVDAQIRGTGVGLSVVRHVIAAHRGLNPKPGPKGVGEAVNQAVVFTFLLLFFVNLVLTGIYLQVIPPKGVG